MDKLAQSKRETGRGPLNWIREKANMPGAYLDSFFKPELDRVMASLKTLDDKVRSELTGKKIGTAEPPASAISAKDLLKSARTHFNRRGYMSGIADMGRFHKKLFDITQEINRFFVDVNKIHNKFLFEGVSDEYKGHIKSLKEHMERKSSVQLSEYFIKEAGIMDFFYNIGTKPGRALAAWEKKYPKETKELREWGFKLLDESDALLNDVIAYMKEMATARATRRPDEYMEAANKIKLAFDKYDSGGKGFKAYYNSAVVPFLKLNEQVEKEMSAKQTPAPTGPTPGKVELGAGPKPPSPPGPSGPPSPPATPAPAPQKPSLPLGGPPGASPPFAPNPFLTPPAPAQDPFQHQEEQAPDTLRDPPKVRVAVPPEEPKQKLRVAAHAKFFASLESMSNEDPRILAVYIAKYAKSIQGDDPETAINLFRIVKQIKG